MQKDSTTTIKYILQILFYERTAVQRIIGCDEWTYLRYILAFEEAGDLR